MRGAIQSGEVAFQPRARLLKLIGAELISDEVLAVTELVKNAHDADASHVTIMFAGVTGPDGAITINDDGHGMGREALLGRWMEPAGTSKGGPAGRFTPGGRRVLGEKGVGRFAADKLARHLELVSRPPRAPREIRALFDWDEYDDPSRMLSEVRSRWEIRPALEIEPHGTVLRLTGLRARWNERTFRRLCSRLSRLRSPFREVNGFRITIESDEFPEYSGELRTDFLDRSPYRIDASFDGGGKIETSVNGDGKVVHDWNGAGELRCGPVRMRVFAFDLETDAIARIGPRMEARAWLREWSGVSVYRDGFRVWPYGEPHDDWLRLDQRRVNNPVVRLSNNQLVGFVEISRDGNPRLLDQTNREGLVHNPEFEDLRRLMYFVLQTLEAERQSIRHPASPRQDRRPAPTAKDGPIEMLEKLAARAPKGFSRDLVRATAQLRRELERQATERRQLVDLYSELAAAGQSSMSFAEIAGSFIDWIRDSTKELRRKGNRQEDAWQVLDEVDSCVEGLSEVLGVLKACSSPGSTRRRSIDLGSELESFRRQLNPLLEGGNFRLDVRLPRDGVLRVEMRPENFHRLLHILATNSLEWMRAVRTPAICIRAREQGRLCEVLFSDNGPGIRREISGRVFEPLYSGREDGRGMGLTIAKNLVESHGGTIEVVSDGRRRGACIRIVLPRKRARATASR